MASKISVSAFEPSAHLGLEVDSKMMKGNMEYTLVPHGESTEVRYEAQMSGKGLFRLMSGKINKMMAAEDDNILERLRSQVEGRHP